MLQVRSVSASSVGKLEDKVNDVLKELANKEVVDIKFTAVADRLLEDHIAYIIYKD